MHQTCWIGNGLFFCGLIVTASFSWASDWPTYRHDVARSGVTSDEVASTLHRQWTYVAPHAPKPAWPEPGRELNRLAFDYAYAVTIAGGRVYFGSSADHKVYAIRLDTGQPCWSFFTEGPVRFAPTISEGRVFVASDDGWLYCLSATDGKLLWRFYGGARDERILGNGQMISRWPLRSGVAVDRGIVYFSAGMWPSEGVFLYALDAETGAVIWRNDTSGVDYRDLPHPGSNAVTGVSPQGILLANRSQLFVPTGRNVPAAYDRETGKLLYYHSQPTTWGDRWGGTWCMLVGRLLFNWRTHVAPDIDVRLGEAEPDPNDGIVAFDAETFELKRDFPGKLCAVVAGKTLYATGRGKVTAYDFEAWAAGAKPTDCMKWETPHGRAYSLILAGKTLAVGGRGTVTLIAADTGRVVWRDTVDGQVRSLAAADGRLLASTTDGQILCYGPDQLPTPRVHQSQPDAKALASGPNSQTAAATARQILQTSGQKEGYALVLGAGDGRLLYQLAAQSNLTIYCLEPDADRVARVRRALAPSFTACGSPFTTEL
ncbi:MAG: PQQ-binding-like beta-propeller repeat protein [Planctomycetes bacterium]|nr:PQQ-binding-like beta-propeller repeat protein [Planctomycetota bacterium]